MSYTTPIKAGTVTLSASSVAVAGSLTNWKLSGASAGDMFFDFSSQFSSPIASVESDTALTLEIPYNGTAGAGKDFVIVSRELQNRFGTASKQINELLTVLKDFGGFAGSTSGLPANSVGEDGDVRIDVATGTFYDKENGVWSAGTTITGIAGPSPSLVSGNVTIGVVGSTPNMTLRPVAENSYAFDLELPPYGTPPPITVTSIFGEVRGNDSKVYSNIIVPSDGLLVVAAFGRRNTLTVCNISDINLNSSPMVVLENNSGDIATHSATIASQLVTAGTYEIDLVTAAVMRYQGVQVYLIENYTSTSAQSSNSDGLTGSSSYDVTLPSGDVSIFVGNVDANSSVSLSAGEVDMNETSSNPAFGIVAGHMGLNGPQSLGTSASLSYAAVSFS